MNAVQINAALHRELSYIVTDEVLMEQALKALRQIRRERRISLALQRLAEIEKEDAEHKTVEEKSILPMT